MGPTGIPLSAVGCLLWCPLGEVYWVPAVVPVGCLLWFPVGAPGC